MISLKHCFAALMLSGALFVTADADAHHGRPPCPPPVPIVLQVCHPCTGCKYDVEVCVPPCCVTEPPRVCFQKTLIGDGKTVYSWSCGHSVTVRYTHGGGYKVIQRG